MKGRCVEETSVEKRCVKGRCVKGRCVEGRCMEERCVASAHRFNYDGFYDRHFKWHGLERGSSRGRKRLGKEGREILMDKIILLQINCFFLFLNSSTIFRYLGQRESEEICKAHPQLLNFLSSLMSRHSVRTFESTAFALSID